MKLFFINFFQKKGFSLIELLTAVSIVGTLSIVGIKSYQNQMNKAKSAEAQHSLSYVYISERNFKENWGTYHENLGVVGAVPSGSYHYDVGFSKNADMSKTDGYLDDYPLTEVLAVQECTNFYQICKGNCVTTTKSSVPTGYANYFEGESCTVAGPKYVKDDTTTYVGNAKAGEDNFKAVAIGTLKDKDIWSIDQSKIITHELDGTQ